MGSMAQTAIPLNVIHLDEFSEGEISQGTHSDVESDDDQPNTRKRNDSSSRGANYVEALSSSAPPVKKIMLAVNLEELTDEWRLPIEEVREVMLEHNASVHEDKDERRSTKLAQMYASTDGGLIVQ
ncbi:unnamed protein product [Lactuca virosa]|uniref:Uncharacterized protein n=1 Tax=Lactuca virosa TaxID=75947 RepID=A0AAU9MA11_9ASTR|nr:unnamed protein product [Lactuca virosa]